MNGKEELTEIEVRVYKMIQENLGHKIIKTKLERLGYGPISRNQIGRLRKVLTEKGYLVRGSMPSVRKVKSR